MSEAERVGQMSRCVTSHLGHIVSRDFQRSPAFTTVLPHSQDGPLRRHVVEDSPGLPEYDILGEFVVFRGRF